MTVESRARSLAGLVLLDVHQDGFQGWAPTVGKHRISARSVARGFKAVFPNLYLTASASWPVWPELVDRIPFWVVCGFIASRIVLAPLWIYQDAIDAAKKQHDEDMDAAESQKIEYERRILAVSGYIPKLPIDKQPLVRLELRHCSHSKEHTYAVAINDGDLAAININGECVLRHGAYTISFGPVNVSPGSEPTLIPIRLFSGGRQLQTSHTRPPECEFPSSSFLSLLGAAQGEFTEGDGRPFVGTVIREPMSCKFNVTYTDPGKRERYNRTHVLKYSRGTAQIALDEGPDPVPHLIADGDPDGISTYLPPA